jgi:microcystin-dependent protein
MGQPYIGEIRMFAGNYAPAGWAFCDGAILSIAENDTLFALIGTTYGGDGQTTFALPDLRGRIPIHQGTALGNTYVLAEQVGVETVTLTSNQAPIHSHAWNTTGVADTAKLSDGYVANGPVASFTSAGPTVALGTSTIASSGGGQPHENMGPYLAVNFIISLFGIFPSQT